MQSTAATVEGYFETLPDDRKEAMTKLRKLFKKNLPKGFKEEMTYGMPGYVIPHSDYPAGYHCNPKLPLPFLSFNSQKNFISVYHMCLYMDKNLMNWFTAEYEKTGGAKLDMGKSCIRFKKPEKIPFEMLGKLAARVTPAEYIKIYEGILKKGKS